MFISVVVVSPSPCFSHCFLSSSTLIRPLSRSFSISLFISLSHSACLSSFLLVYIGLVSCCCLYISLLSLYTCLSISLFLSHSFFLSLSIFKIVRHRKARHPSSTLDQELSSILGLFFLMLFAPSSATRSSPNSSTPSVQKESPIHCSYPSTSTLKSVNTSLDSSSSTTSRKSSFPGSKKKN